MEKLVSIIVPVYGVQDFIEKNMHSLLSQSYTAIEYLIVDDCTPDNSVYIVQEILRLYPDRKESVKIIRHKVNRGLPAARNTGLSAAKGDYIFHCDSDDWVEPNMISDLVKSLEGSGADIAYCDFYLSFHKNSRYMKQPSFNNPKDCLKAMLRGDMKFNVWNKLIKTSLYREFNISFPEGRSMGEDMTIMKLYAHAKEVSHVSKAYYHYMQTNPNAYTKMFSDKQLEDVQWNTVHIIRYLEGLSEFKSMNEEFDFFKLNVKLPFLISTDREMYDLWRTWFPESNSSIGRNKCFSLRTKLIQYAALYRQYWFLKIYNIIVVKFVYGIIYK